MSFSSAYPDYEDNVFRLNILTSNLYDALHVQMTKKSLPSSENHLMDYFENTLSFLFRQIFDIASPGTFHATPFLKVDGLKKEKLGQTTWGSLHFYRSNFFFISYRTHFCHVFFTII